MPYITREEFRAALLAIFEDIHELEKGTRNSKQTEHGERSHSIPAVTKLDSVSSIETRTPESEKRDDSRYKLRSLLVQWCTCGIVFIYAAIAALQWCATTKANEIAQRAIEAQTRPFLSPTDDPKNMRLVNFPTGIDFDMSIRNFGNSVGSFLPPKFVFSETNLPRVNVPLAERICKEAKTGINQSELIENTVFPGEAGIRTKTVSAWTEDYQSKRRPQYAIGCIAYIGSGSVIYYTQVAYLLTFASDNVNDKSPPTGLSLAWTRQYPNK